jgi:hypothetical protein
VSEILSNKKVASECSFITRSRAEIESEWEGIVKALNGNFLHSMAWSRYIAGPHHEPSYFLIQRSGRTIAAGWYILFAKTVGLIRNVKHFKMENLPCYDPEQISASDVFREVCSLASREKCLSFDFGNSSGEYRLPGVKDSLQEKISFSLDLQKPLEEIYAHFNVKHRKKIRRAEHSGLRINTVRDSAAYALADELEGLFDYCYRRHCTLGKARGRHRPSIITDIVHDLVLTGNAIIFVASFNNIPVSCYIVSTFNRQASNLFGASNAMGYELNASFLLVWKIIEYLKEHDYLVLNIGAVPASSKEETDRDHGLYRHKKGFGAQTSVLRSGTVILHPIQHTVLSAISKWKTTLKSRLSL